MEDDLRVVSERSEQQETRAKLLEVRKDVPFIRSVRESHENTLSRVQSQRLQALIGLLDRDNVSMLTLNKIERIVNKLKTKFNPRFSDVIDISDQNSNELPSNSSTSSTASCSVTAAKPSEASRSANAAKPSDASRSATAAKPSEAPRSANAAKPSEASRSATAAKPSEASRSATAAKAKPSSASRSKSADVKPSEAPKVTPATKKTEGSKPSLGDATKAGPAPLPTPVPAIPKAPAAVSPGGVLAAMQEARLKEIEMRSNASSQFTRRTAVSAKETVSSAAPPLSPPQFSRRVPSAPPDKPDFVRRSTTSLVQEASRNCDLTSPERDTYSMSTASPPSPGLTPTSTNSLEEARKKLAALRGGPAATGQDQPAALASNLNDPRGKKPSLITALPKHDRNNSSSVGNVSPPPMVRILSPIPPAPSMKPSISSWFTYNSIPVGNVCRTSSTISISSSNSNSSSATSHGDQPPMLSRSLSQSSGSDIRRSFNGNQDPRDPRESRDPREGRSDSRDPRRENHNPRDPRMGRSLSSHGPQQHRSHTPPYSGDPRRGTGTYANIDESHHWQSMNGNGNGNGNANKYTKPNWGANPNANTNNIPVSGFNGSSRPRGGFRGGSHNPSMGRYGRPNAGPACNGSPPDAGLPHVPRTYREHKEAKARANAAVQAMIAEELRVLEAEKQRLLEAVEKESQQDKDKEDAEQAAAAPAPAGPVPEPQLDTLYRSSTGSACTPAKKIDFRIPKKSATATSSPSSISCDGEGDTGSSASPKPSKSCDAGKDRDNKISSKTDDKSKQKDRDMEANKTNDKIKGKDKDKSETKKHHKKADKKSRSSTKEDKKRLDKDKGREKEKEKKSSSSREVLDTDSVVSVASSSENNENLENEPPVEEVPPPIYGLSPALSEEAEEKLDLLRGGKKIPTLVNGEVMENGVENQVVDDIRGVEADEEKAEPPKLSKMKIVLGPNAHSQLLHNENAATSDDVKPMDLFTDKHDDTEVPAPPMQELRRIMTRRYSMVPKASQPLVDKTEILTGGSLLYEDLQEQRRQSQRARHLANIFEKTSDNCRISTQNIITGKRRTRGGGPEASFNETELSRRCFGLGQISRSRRSEGTKATAADVAVSEPSKATATAAAAVDVALGESSKATAPPAADVAVSEPFKATATAAVDVALGESAKATAPAAIDVVFSEPSTSSEAATRKRRRSEADEAKVADVVVLEEDLPQPPPARKPRYKARRPKRNELDKLNEDIAQMYNGEDVLRATGRRACTQRSRTPSMPPFSPPPETNSSLSSRMSSPLIIRNVARRGKRFTGPSTLNVGLTRAAFQAQCQRLVVRIRRDPSLERMARELTEKREAQNQGKKAAKPGKRRKVSGTNSEQTTMEVRNVNREWHATSAATITCVICNVSIRKSPLLHYIQHHGEHYGSRLPPGMLNELRAGRNQRPDYWILQGATHVYHFKCPFCVKVMNMRTLDLGDHIVTHTGERRYQCSHCLLSLQRLHILEEHIKNCAPGASIVKFENCGLMPICLHVCHLCEFVQISGAHMDRHLVQQHGLKEEELPDLERERVMLCTLEGVPRASSLAEGQKIVERNERNALEETTEPEPTVAATSTKAKAKPKATGKASKKNSKDDDERPSTSKAAQKKAAAAAAKKKVKIRFQNMAKKTLNRVKREREEQAKDQEGDKEDDEVLAPQGVTLPEANSEAVPADIKVLPLPPPEKENLLVVNECLMDQDMEMELEELADEEQALLDKDQSMMVEEKPLQKVDMDEDVDVHVDVESLDDEPAEESANPLPTQTDPERATDAPAMGTDPEKAATKPKTLLNQELSLSELDADLLDGIGSDASDDSNFGDDTNIEEPVTDEWIDLETAERNRKASKNPFQSFTRFCSRLNKGSRAARSWPSNASGSSSEDGQDSPDPSELMPSMRPLEPETTSTATTKTKVEVQSPPQSSAAATPSAPAAAARKSPLKRIENVAYRQGVVGGVTGKCPAYYCIYPGCTFLFSNELEGLENHFAQEHPTVRWTGTCALCPRTRKQPDGQPHSISEELRHMTDGHMAPRRSDTFDLTEEDSPAPEPTAAAATTLFKLRVRRFTGDRLAEPQPAEENPAATAGAAVAAGGDANGMLRGLLQAEPRPPNQVDFNAAGLGEFLCAKPPTPPREQPATSATTTTDPPTVINYQSGLGLAISQVFNGASVPMPVLDSPSVASSVPAAAVAAAVVTVTLPVPDESRSRLVADRFRCMATNCGFCAHTVMCIREHMKFHSFSFGSNDYLNCAYCNHVATDLDDYIRHGIVVHSLAPNSDLHGIPVETPSVSQQIRAMLNQRGNVTVRSLTAQGPTAAAAPPPAPVVVLPPAANNMGGTGVEAGGSAASEIPDVGLAPAITELLRPTGYSEDKLYACPQKGCIVRLTDEQFVNHLRYHIRSTFNQGSEQVKCKYCAQKLLPPSLRTHLQQAHARHKLFCSLCLATAANKRLMLYHVRNQHSQEFELINRQLQFIQLPTDPEVAKGGGAAAAGATTDANSILLAAVCQPFGKLEMERFQRQLLEELQLRRQGTKTNYRGSEVRLLPRMPVFSRPINCAECKFSTEVRTVLQSHLYEHKERVVREAYQTEEESLPEAAAEVSGIVDSVPVAENGDAAAATATATAAEVAPQSSVEAPVEPPAVRPPGQHKAVMPRFVYVPSDHRYRCGVARCFRLLGTELELRKHMTLDHSYSDDTFCHHCKVPLQGQNSVDKYLAHLMMHKRHIYQCGACMRYNHKRVAIERHIQDRHPLHEVDVVVHRHNDTHLNTSARWLKTPKVTRATMMEYICNLCQLILPTAVQIMAHAVAVHGRQYQYHCAYCSLGHRDASEVIDHMLGTHAHRRVQPVQVYQQITHKKSQTLGLYCIVCLKAATTCLRIGQHCEEMHKSRFQWQCPHCDFGHQQERIVSQHLEMSHPRRIGLAVMQFDRVTNDIPDALSWELGQPIEEAVVEPAQAEEQQQEQQQQQEEEQEPEPEQHAAAASKVAEAQPQQQQPSQTQHIITAVVDLVGSDDEREEPEIAECHEERKIVEFACTHCNETNSNLQDLRTQHWAHVHPDQPFYFRVQPQLLCSECKRFRSNAKTLIEDHLTKVHAIRNIVACDVRRPEECAYCDYKYHNWKDLAQHISKEGHLPNDLKNVTDDELAALQQLSASSDGAKNEYYQCDLCSVVTPTKSAIAQHGRVEHSRPGERFCFRQLTTPLIYHCFFCIFTSAEELTTLRHMVDHYNRFLYCHFCSCHLPGGFDEYIQHCYSLHRDEVHRFRELHRYTDLRKFLINVHYQFQNGLIITKSSLRRTRFNDEQMMRALYAELMAKVRRPPIRLLINLKSVQGQQQQQPVQEPEPLARITQRRKTLNPDEMLRLSRQELSPAKAPPQREQQPRPPPKVITRIVTPMARRLMSGKVPTAAASVPSTSAAASSATAPQVPAAQEPLVRITKRRKTLGPDEMQRLSRQEQQQQQQQNQPAKKPRSSIVTPFGNGFMISNVAAAAVLPSTSAAATSAAAEQVPSAAGPAAQEALVRITQRRKTLGPDEMQRLSRQQEQSLQQQHPQPSANVTKGRVFTSLANPMITSPSTLAAAAAAPPAVTTLRIVKRRNSYVVHTGP